MEQSDTPAAPRAVLIESDLFFAGRLLSVLINLSWHTERASTPEQAHELIDELTPEIILVNLAARSFDAIDLIRQLKPKAGAARFIAYMSHTRIPEVREDALAAGADVLVANSAVTMRLPGIIKEVMEGS